MRIDFYQLGHDPVEDAVAQIAQKVLEADKRLIVVADDEALRGRIGETLWARPNSFLANDHAGGKHDARQPILLAAEPVAMNGATCLALADGIWREAEGFERVFLFFDEQTVEAARGLWRELGSREGAERHFWKQQGGRWTEAG